MSQLEFRLLWDRDPEACSACPARLPFRVREHGDDAALIKRAETIDLLEVEALLGDIDQGGVGLIAVNPHQSCEVRLDGIGPGIALKPAFLLRDYVHFLERLVGPPSLPAAKAVHRLGKQLRTMGAKPIQDDGAAVLRGR